MSLLQRGLFIFSFYDTLGEQKLIGVTDNWDAFKACCGQGFGVFQLLENEFSLEIKILVERIAFKKEFTDYGDKLLNNILTFCKNHGYLQLSQTSQADQFFK